MPWNSLQSLVSSHLSHLPKTTNHKMKFCTSITLIILAAIGTSSSAEPISRPSGDDSAHSLSPEALSSLHEIRHSHMATKIHAASTGASSFTKLPPASSFHHVVTRKPEPTDLNKREPKSPKKPHTTKLHKEKFCNANGACAYWEPNENWNGADLQ